MSLAQFFADLLLVYAIALSLLITLQIIGASLHDIKLTRQRRLRLLHPYATAYRSRPLVTIIFIVQNHDSYLNDCLESLRRSSYRKLQMLVVDNASTDSTRVVCSNYIKEHPKLDIRLFSKRKLSDTVSLIKSVKRYIKGELVIAIDGDTQLEKGSVRLAINHLQEQPDTAALIPNIAPANPYTFRGLMRSYQSMLGQRSHKAMPLLAKPYRSGVLITRRSALGGILRHQLTKAEYAEDVQIRSNSYSEPYNLVLVGNKLIGYMHSLSQLIVTILTPVILSYFIYLAVGLSEPIFLLISMGGIALLLLFAVWENDRLALRQRLAYSIGIPITYSSLYIASWWKLINTLRNLVITY